MSLGLGIGLSIGLFFVGAAISAVITILMLKLKASNEEENATNKAKKLLSEAEEKSRKMVEEADNKVDSIIRKAEQEGRANAQQFKHEAEQELRDRKIELAARENKVNQREQNIDRRDTALIEREKQIENKADALQERIASIDKREKEVEEKVESIDHILEKIGNMTSDQARAELFKRVEEKTKLEMTAYIKQQEEEAKEKAEDNARNLIGLAIDKFSQEVVSEKTISAVALPSDEMKGRIIGREGRNIRTIEQLTGVDIIIDDTPEVITVSCFDPIRREIARRSLEALIKDGRIQPGRIEEIVEKCKKEVEESIHKKGQEVAFKLGLPRINKELLDYVGRLKYRTSYGQNALDHSVEVAYLAGIMAAELGLDQNLAKRAGLLHDIGKSVDQTQEGTHIQLGVELASRYGEKQEIIHAIEAHHNDVTANTIEAVLVKIADAISAGRPGARRDTLEIYIKRLQKIEEIVNGYEGIKQSFAVQAGREVRVIVQSEQFDDLASQKLARDIAKKIEDELDYPGQIKVTVVREFRATEIAK